MAENSQSFLSQIWNNRIPTDCIINDASFLIAANSHLWMTSWEMIDFFPSVPQPLCIRQLSLMRCVCFAASLPSCNSEMARGIVSLGFDRKISVQLKFQTKEVFFHSQNRTNCKLPFGKNNWQYHCQELISRVWWLSSYRINLIKKKKLITSYEPFTGKCFCPPDYHFLYVHGVFRDRLLSPINSLSKLSCKSVVSHAPPLLP